MNIYTEGPPSEKEFKLTLALGHRLSNLVILTFSSGFGFGSSRLNGVLE